MARPRTRPQRMFRIKEIPGIFCVEKAFFELLDDKTPISLIDGEVQFKPLLSQEEYSESASKRMLARHKQSKN